MDKILVEMRIVVDATGNTARIVRGRKRDILFCHGCQVWEHFKNDCLRKEYEHFEMEV